MCDNSNLRIWGQFGNYELDSHCFFKQMQAPSLEMI